VTPPVAAGGGGLLTTTTPTRSARDQTLVDFFTENQKKYDLGTFKTELDKLGYTAEDVARVTGTPLAEVKRQYELAVSTPTTPYKPYVAPATPATPATPVTPVVKPPVVTAPVTPTTPTRSLALTWSLNNGLTEEQYYKKVREDYKRAVDLKLTDAQIRSTMEQYGISAADLAIATGSDIKTVEERVTKAVPKTPEEIAYDKAAKEELAAREAKAAAERKAADEAQKRKAALDYAAEQKALADAERAKLDALRTPEKNPFLNAGPLNPELPPGQIGFTQPTQPESGPLTFAENLKNYQSIPVGAQYNPFAVGGTGSPYSQIMAQAKPLGNPYANALAGQSMGGFNPALYAQAAATYKAEADAAAAAAAAAARLDPSSTGGGGGDDGDDGGDGTGTGPGTGAASGDCVDPDVHILLADRSTVRAGDLKVGDMLHTLHDETFVYGDFPVEYVNVLQRPKVEALFDDGQKIIISITHKFLTADNKWEKISDLEIGTSIRGFGDVTKKLVSITDVGTGPVIEMVVTDAHTYISEGLVSHNKFYGGLITNVSGPDPAGPDEGQVNMMRGEYVIKKSSVNKYGKGLLDMINEGKIPAKKIRSLLD